MEAYGRQFRMRDIPMRKHLLRLLLWRRRSFSTAILQNLVLVLPLLTRMIKSLEQLRTIRAPCGGAPFSG